MRGLPARGRSRPKKRLAEKAPIQGNEAMATSSSTTAHQIAMLEDLEQYVQSLEDEEVLLIGGDFNGHVGSRKDWFESCHGGYGFGARNDDGLRILEYAVASDLIIANTQYRKRKSHLITYTSGGRETQIDFWMLRRRDRRLLQDSNVIPTNHVAAHRSTLDMEHTDIVKGADGVLLRRPSQILERWREYYNHLCNEEFWHPPIPTVPSFEGPVLPITAVEVSAALAKWKSNKATGPDDIPADVWKLLGDRGSVWLATLFNKIVAEGRTPDVWHTSVTVPVWKGKGDIADCTSYRPIRLLCHTMKVFEGVLEVRLRKIISVSLNQCGFVKDCSTIELSMLSVSFWRNIERRTAVCILLFSISRKDNEGNPEAASMVPTLCR
ncbi:hypothetical protein RB195_026548 [Necator americanus]